MIQPGTQFGKRGRKTTTNSSEESKWLELVIMALTNQGGQLSAILAALGGSPTPYNTVQGYSLLSADTMTIPAGSVHSFSFTVVKGRTQISLDGGGTTVDYPAGTNMSLNATTLINRDINILVNGVASDGNNILIISTTAI